MHMEMKWERGKKYFEKEDGAWARRQERSAPVRGASTFPNSPVAADGEGERRTEEEMDWL